MEMLKIPASLNRNAKCVSELADPADSGLMLINYMCTRLGVESLAGLDVLDFGCGTRFSQTIINRGAPIGTYTGVEIEKQIVDYLTENVMDTRLSYVHLDMSNTFYNPAGPKFDVHTPSPLGSRKFDVICMFSVITHQQPNEAATIFGLLRKHIKPDGRLFFSAFIHDDDVQYKERDPGKPGHKSSYSLPYMKSLLENATWSISSIADPRPEGIPIMTSFVCMPAG